MGLFIGLIVRIIILRSICFLTAAIIEVFLLIFAFLKAKDMKEHG